MKNYLMKILLLAAVPVFFTACDVISPANLDSFVFENSVDPQSSLYCGEESTDTDGDGIGDYLDADEIILLEPEDKTIVVDDILTFSIKPKSTDLNVTYGFIISENENLSDPLVAKDGLDSPSFFLSVSGQALSVFTTYYWAATVTDTNGAYTSDIRSFNRYIETTRYIELAGGYSHTLAVTDADYLKSWGNNMYGMLGDGSTTESLIPILISGFSDIAEVSACNGGSLALKSNGTVWTWGRMGYEQIGLDYSTDDKNYPTEIDDLSGIISICMSYDYSMALKSDGTVLAWGDNDDGQLGNGTYSDETTPVEVLLADGETPLTGIIEISCAGHLSAAVKDDGTVWTWGANADGELGVSTATASRNTAARVVGLSDVIGIASGGQYMNSRDWVSVYAIQGDGTVKAWGYNYYGQLGNNSTDDSATPVSVLNIENIVSISAGLEHCLALTEAGELWSWGYNNYGQLGDGTNDSCHYPRKIDGISAIEAIGTGWYHSIALDEDSGLWTWGYNGSGQLGDGTQTNRTSPVEITGF